jgi:putative NADPH-quinone reductase
MSYFKDHKPKKILLLLGHPDADTLTGQLALLYESAAKKAGHEVRRFNIGQMKFDPVLHKGYKQIQELEPDLMEFQRALQWCEHFVVLYPNWWQTMPAILKGLFDRAWLPGVEFQFYKKTWRRQLHLWKPLMKGKTARVLVLSGAPPIFNWLFYGDYTNEIKNGILHFAGFKTRVTHLGPTEDAPEWLLNGWRRRAAYLGRLGE